VFWNRLPPSVLMFLPFVFYILVFAFIAALGADTRSYGFLFSARTGASVLLMISTWTASVFVPEKMLRTSKKDPTTMLQQVSETSAAESLMWLLAVAIPSGLNVYDTAVFSGRHVSSALVIALAVATGVLVLGQLGAKSFRVHVVKMFGERDGPQRAYSSLANMSLRIGVMSALAVFAWLCSLNVFNNHPFLYSSVTRAQQRGRSGALEVCGGLSIHYPPMNSTYLVDHCVKGLGDDGGISWQCNDGGYGGYGSRYDACRAFILLPGAEARGNAAVALVVRCAHFCAWSSWAHFRADAWKRGGLISLCDALVIGLIAAFGLSDLVFLLVANNPRGIVTNYYYGWVPPFIFMVMGLAHVLMYLFVGVRARLTHLLEAGRLEFDCFLSHAWDADSSGRNNHERVMQVHAALSAEGIKTCVDKDNLDADLNNEMSEGIDRSKLVLVFVTQVGIFSMTEHDWTQHDLTWHDDRLAVSIRHILTRCRALGDEAWTRTAKLSLSTRCGATARGGCSRW
jgi:hypothetical protein